MFQPDETFVCLFFFGSNHVVSVESLLEPFGFDATDFVVLSNYSKGNYANYSNVNKKQCDFYKTTGGLVLRMNVDVNTPRCSHKYVHDNNEIVSMECLKMRF